MTEDGHRRSSGSELPDRYAAVQRAIQALLDACDYTEGHCDPAEAVCAVISPEMLAMARKALAL